MQKRSKRQETLPEVDAAGRFKARVSQNWGSPWDLFVRFVGEDVCRGVEWASKFF